MATNSGSGSILFKVIIALLAVILVLIIKIPDSIWDEEKTEKSQSQFNITSIYEAQKYYHRLTDKYTTDKNELLEVIKKDSTLFQTQQLVNYTQQLAQIINNYLSNDLINGYLTIDQTIQTIVSDLATNERHFKINQEILATSEELRLKLGVFNSDLNYPHYSACVSYLDSLYQLRRDMSDYTLQTAASMSAHITERANSYLPNIKNDKLSSDWSDLSAKLKEFRIAIKNDENVSGNTTVGDKLKDFVEKIDNTVGKLSAINNSQNLNITVQYNTQLNELYQSFLTDFLITSKFGLYRLSLEDSMVLYISEKNFVSPVTGEEYILIINTDSTDVGIERNFKVESPLLVRELKDQLSPLSDQISKLDFISHYLEYKDSIIAINKKGVAIKNVIRRDINITVKNKEIEATIEKYSNGSEHTAALHLQNFIETAKNSSSYSDLKESISEARNAIGIFNQVYAGNVFDNIDSLTVEMNGHVTEFNKILDENRRLPKEVTKFNFDAFGLDRIAEKIKSQSPSTNSETLAILQSNLEDALLFASEGKSIRVYGVFKKALENFGYIYKNSKSWEEN